MTALLCSSVFIFVVREDCPISTSRRVLANEHLGCDGWWDLKLRYLTVCVGFL